MKLDKNERRTFIKMIGALGISSFLYPSLVAFQMKNTMLKRTIPFSGKKLPVVGVGTWRTFDAGNNPSKLTTLKKVLIEMHRRGGLVIDSSPMYGSSEQVVGKLTSKLSFQNDFFYATKVWTHGQNAGIEQMERSMALIQRKKMDLIQIHNLTDWKTHIKTLRSWKEKEKIMYWGITHYVDGAHEELEKIIKAESPDFVQFNYSIISRHAERSLFETAAKYKVATIINQPFEGGSLFRIIKNRELPEWCHELDINSWGQFFLKFIISNPNVTCVIPGTSKPHHVIDNTMAGYGKIPNTEEREKIYQYIKKI